MRSESPRRSDQESSAVRIAILPLSYLPTIGGAEFVVHNAALEHERAGHTVAVFPNLESRSVWRHVPYTTVPVWRRAWSIAANDGHDERGGAHVRNALRLRLHALQRWFKADVWHIHAAHPVGWAVIDVLQRELHVPVVITSHGGDIYDYESAASGTNEAFGEDIELRVHRTLHSADALIAVGPKVEASYFGYGIAPEKIATIPHGWHPDRVADAAANASQTRHAIGAGDGLVALTVAADRPEKRLDDLLEVATLLDDSSWTLVVATVGDRFANEVVRRGLGHRIIVRQEQSLSPIDLQRGLPRQAILDLYGLADVMILPSLIEASPTVVHEAFTAGCPVLITSDAASGVVDDGVNATIVQARQPEAIANALRRLEDDRSLRTRLANGAQSTGSAFPTWATVAERHRDVYTSVID